VKVQKDSAKYPTEVRRTVNATGQPAQRAHVSSGNSNKQEIAPSAS
jgi:hypothetical protein